MMISKVIRNNRRHITRADYNGKPVVLTSKNVVLPKVSSLQARALRRLFPTGATLSHRGFDFESHSYRLGSFIGSLRDKGWPIVNHDERAKTKDRVPRKATFTRYELFALFDSELKERVGLFIAAVDKFETEAAKKIA